MSPKRGDRVAPPPIGEEWDVRFLSTDAAKGWEELCRQASTNARWAYDLLRNKPRPRVENQRHHRVRHIFGHGGRGSDAWERWQIEVTGSGRVWYLVDDDKHTVWIDLASTGHPKATD